MSSKPYEGLAWPGLSSATAPLWRALCLLLLQLQTGEALGHSGSLLIPPQYVSLGLSTPASKEIHHWGGFIPVVSLQPRALQVLWRSQLEDAAWTCSSILPLLSQLPLRTPQPKHKLGSYLARICHRLKQTRSIYSQTNCSFQAIKITELILYQLNGGKLADQTPNLSSEQISFLIPLY